MNDIITTSSERLLNNHLELDPNMTEELKKFTQNVFHKVASELYPLINIQIVDLDSSQCIVMKQISTGVQLGFQSLNDAPIYTSICKDDYDVDRYANELIQRILKTVLQLRSPTSVSNIHDILDSQTSDFILTNNQSVINVNRDVQIFKTESTFDLDDIYVLGDRDGFVVALRTIHNIKTGDRDSSRMYAKGSILYNNIQQSLKTFTPCNE